MVSLLLSLFVQTAGIAEDENETGTVLNVLNVYGVAGKGGQPWVRVVVIVEEDGEGGSLYTRDVQVQVVSGVLKDWQELTLDPGTVLSAA